MISTDKPFDWRAFWADLLQGSGRALLTLDGSDAARAAMTGLDYFDAAQSRRAERHQDPAEEDPEDPLEGARERAGDVRVVPAWRRYDSGIDDQAQAALGPYFSPFTRPLGSMIRMRPEPMSANPYDLGGLPAQVSFSPTRPPMIRRR